MIFDIEEQDVTQAAVVAVAAAVFFADMCTENLKDII